MQSEPVLMQFKMALCRASPSEPRVAISCKIVGSFFLWSQTLRKIESWSRQLHLPHYGLMLVHKVFTAREWQMSRFYLSSLGVWCSRVLDFERAYIANEPLASCITQNSSKTRVAQGAKGKGVKSAKQRRGRWRR